MKIVLKMTKVNTSKTFIIIINIFFLLVINYYESFGQKADKPFESKKAMVVSANLIASQIGVDVMKMCGNAVDATVATAFALSVCYPSAGNIGGGGFVTLRLSNGDSYCLDFRETAPEKSISTMFLDKNGDFDMKISTQSQLGAGVPGSVDGLITLHEKFGKLPFKALIQPAIDLAKNGFKISEKQAGSFNQLKVDFLKRNKIKPAFVKDGNWKAGDLLLQPELAHTLELIRDFGRDGFYKGETADKIIAEMLRGNGIMAKRDLETYHCLWKKPIIGFYKEYKIITMPPPSSGGVALMQMLTMIENQPISKWGNKSIKTIHLLTEVEKRAYSDRAKYLGDPAYFSVPVDSLLNKKYLKFKFSDFNENNATPSEKIAFSVPIGKESTETTHFSVVDSDGNAISCTTTLNSGYGSKIVVDGAGFLLNNEMDDFSAKENAPNQFGLVGGAANAIRPGKRMLSSMTPTILEKNGKLFMVIGSPGGAFIITSVFQSILNVIEFDMNIQQSVAEKRYHHQWMPDEIKIEAGTFTDQQISELQKLGHKIFDEGSFARVDAILILGKNRIQGGADPRGDDAAAGY